MSDDDVKKYSPPLAQLAGYFSIGAFERAAASATDDELATAFGVSKQLAPYLKTAMEVAAGHVPATQHGKLAGLTALSDDYLKLIDVLRPVGTLKDIRTRTPYPYDAANVEYLAHMVGLFCVLSYFHHKDRIDRLFLRALVSLVGMLWPKSFPLVVQAVRKTPRLAVDSVLKHPEPVHSHETASWAGTSRDRVKAKRDRA